MYTQEELFSCPTEKKEASPKLRIPAMLASEARGVDYLVLWLDCDKEGENICFEVIDAVKSSMKRSGDMNVSTNLIILLKNNNFVSYTSI